MTTTRVIAGMIDKGVEFFSVNGNAMCMHNGSVYSFCDMPPEILSIVKADMKSKPKAEKAMEKMVGLDEEAKLQKFITCQFGALNSDHDIDEKGELSAPEYSPCSERGACKYEGVGCCLISAADGQFLSKSEASVLKLVEFEDKIIADKLFLSTETVKKHFQNIRRKTGKQGKTELAIWAILKGII